MWQTKETSISEIKQLLEDGFEIEVDSPDGWVPVVDYVDKGLWEEYTLKTDNGYEVRCNENHLFKTFNGWMTAAQLLDVQERLGHYCSVITEKGPSPAIVFKSPELIPIVDITVDHDNHRYYTAGIESHNTGVGKTLAMCHFCASYLALGKNVLYITMEMAEEKIAERIDSNLLNVAMEDLHMLSKDVYEKKINRIKEKSPGRLIIKEYPTSTAGAANFRHLLNELKIKRNFVPDIIFIDYLNICASSRIKQGANVNSYTYIKAIAEELRGLAVEFNVPIVSATQTTRGGYDSSDVGLTDTSESFGLPATADFMVALIATDELKALNQIMIKQLKNRYADPEMYKRFVVGVDRSKMRLYDAEQSAQDDIVDDTPVYDNTPSSKFDRSKMQGFK